jgi:hypothetical protein
MRFTFDYIEEEYNKLIDAGYKFMTCEEYALNKTNLNKRDKFIINRVDIDFSVKKTEILINIFNKINIKATFFLRLHAPEYNPFSFENYRIIKKLVETGHELGYHSEIVDQATIWNENQDQCLIRDISTIENFYKIKIKGVASHGGITGLNNLDFWNERKPCNYGLLYEAYDKESDFNLFQDSLYISDSEWTNWKCYYKGKLLNGDKRSPSEHIINNHKLIYLLIHPDTYFFRHIYE